ncbi:MULTISPECIES: type II secretion system protein [unclassified Campylobacter]|uniref:type II secretion system protein n=1 Tax=unclassified Campylobacter TaxID=2593542 RepID=UPI0022E9DF8E|nr:MULTISPECIES: type II secretion system protein [unclassified Campylobacter]MDA3055737.1 type II secretion system GspH family protein [Campylobacter sp. CN_NA1]MDA3064999.1 type II secretion system GspH family protein [Campylobacter sp. CN_NE4]MDA3068593.1 type II secretion system GspH family protein [Campylobacter sp. CN_NE3]MDA3082084.1 type II secretion system GspH family protein [Campylobacter sp. CN_EL2]MDA3084178.1 type II secretion system GspH family protein [Campylobacter sp. CN_NE1]
MKNGFTMIELIFTIVILAITTMAIPRMVAQTAELNILAIQQELVANAKTAVVQVAKAPWDSAYATVETSCANIDLDCNVPIRIHEVPTTNVGVFVPTNKIAIVDESGNQRATTSAQPTPKARFGSREDNASATSVGSGKFNDIDDYDVSFVQTVGPTEVGGNTGGDFILNTRVSVSVNYISEPSVNYVNGSTINTNLGFGTASIAANPTNIKLVEITATDTNSTDPNRSVVLRYYAFNIGMPITTLR